MIRSLISIAIGFLFLFCFGCVGGKETVTYKVISASTMAPIPTMAPTPAPTPETTPVQTSAISDSKADAVLFSLAEDSSAVGETETDSQQPVLFLQKDSVPVISPDISIDEEQLQQYIPETAELEEMGAFGGGFKESVTIGAVGDIMAMPSQLAAAYDEETGIYDFSRSFTAASNMFNQIDLMCGNMEGAVAGAKVGYSNGVQDSEGRIKFNAPDELVIDLKNAGFDVLTTANNHASDCGADGIAATIDAIRKTGIVQTGTYKSAEDRTYPIVLDVSGFKIGILASTTVINSSTKLSHKQKDDMFSRLQYTDQIREDILRCKNAGAEFIIMFVHWDKEYKNSPQKSTKKYAQQLLEMGVDAVIGSHPHVVQPFSYITVTREDGSSYTGFVAYSLGNFLSNMSGESCYELFLQLQLSRNDAGIVYLKSASYMPFICYGEEIEEPDDEGKKKKSVVHQVIPCLESLQNVNCFNGWNDRKLQAAEKAREHVLSVCGTTVVPVMEDSCWIN